MRFVKSSIFNIIFGHPYIGGFDIYHCSGVLFTDFFSVLKMRNIQKEAGAELCQAQVKFSLV